MTDQIITLKPGVKAAPGLDGKSHTRRAYIKPELIFLHGEDGEGKASLVAAEGNRYIPGYTIGVGPS